MGKILEFPIQRARDVTSRKREEYTQRIYQEAIEAVLREYSVSDRAEGGDPAKQEVLRSIHNALTYAFLSRDWEGARRMIEIAARKAAVHAAIDRESPR